MCFCGRGADTRNAHTCVSETPCETPPSVITICNYEAYQFQLGETETPCETPPNGEVKRHPERHPEQTINKGIRKGNDNGASAPTATSNARGNGRAKGPYVFQGEYLRLNADDFAKLKKNYSSSRTCQASCIALMRALSIAPRKTVMVGRDEWQTQRQASR